MACSAVSHQLSSCPVVPLKDIPVRCGASAVQMSTTSLCHQPKVSKVSPLTFGVCRGKRVLQMPAVLRHAHLIGHKARCFQMQKLHWWIQGRPGVSLVWWVTLLYTVGRPGDVCLLCMKSYISWFFFSVLRTAFKIAIHSLRGD